MIFLLKYHQQGVGNFNKFGVSVCVKSLDADMNY